MNVKHTPGEWFVKSGSLTVLADDPRSTIICEVTGHTSNQQSIADARLIAAAPDLLEALIDLCNSNDEVAHPQWKGSPDEIAARAAIAKARGDA